ncbi:MAG: glycosyltransferase [Clostridia bacterium]|nr:glycosyltransferase [Clostridia bacterium]
MISIIIPCYNEGESIKEHVKVVKDYLAANNIDAEIICVSDGSKDDTFKIIKEIDGIIPTGYEVNRGKGGAVKFGVEQAKGDYCLFMDADLSTDLKAVSDVLPYLGDYDIIIGSRHSEGSDIAKKQPLKRQFIGWCCRKIVAYKFKIKHKDTQCGFKAIKTSVAKEMAKRQIIDGFAFDVEYLYMAKLNGLKVKEIPVKWTDDRGSTVSPVKSSLRFMKDLGRIKKNKKAYLFGVEN